MNNNNGSPMSLASFGFTGVGTPANPRRPGSQATTPRSQAKNFQLQLATLAARSPEANEADRQDLAKGFEMELAKELKRKKVEAKIAVKKFADSETALRTAEAKLSDLKEEEQQLKERAGVVDAQAKVSKAERELAEAVLKLGVAEENVDTAKVNVEAKKKLLTKAQVKFEGQASAVIIHKLAIARDEIREKKDAYERANKVAEDANEELATARADYEEFKSTL